jgi:hypothetical protein
MGMIVGDQSYYKCDHSSGCKSTSPPGLQSSSNPSLDAKKLAQKAGWQVTNEDKSYCPKHAYK